MRELKLPRVMVPLFWISLLGAWIVLFVTKPWGLGLSADSIAYIEAAKSFVRDQAFLVYSHAGISQPMIHYPPLFPFLLSWGWFLGLDMYFWAGILNALSFAVTIFLAGMIGFKVTRQVSTAIFSAVLVMASVQVLESQIQLFSEPFFLAQVMAFLLLLSLYLERQGRGSFYGLALLAASLGLMRYAGVLLILVGVIAIAKYSSGEKREKLEKAGLFALISFVPCAIWLIRNMAQRGQLIEQVYALPVPFLSKAHSLINALSEWLLPAQVPEILRWVVLGIVLGVGIVAARRKWFETVSQRPLLETLLELFAVVYFAGIVLFVVVTGDERAVSRQLIPFYSVLLILLAIHGKALWQGEKFWRFVRYALRGALILLVGVMFLRSLQLCTAFHKRGFGYNSKAWADSNVIKNIRSLDDVPVYANDPEAFYYLTGRASVKIPAANEGANYFSSITKVKADLEHSRGVVLIFKPVSQEHPLWVDVKRAVSFERYMGDGVADIYGVKKSGAVKQ